MKSITTKYHGPTDARGARISATDCGDHKITVSYDHGAKNPHADAALALARKLNWTGTLQGGGTKDGQVFVFIDKSEQYKI